MGSKKKKKVDGGTGTSSENLQAASETTVDTANSTMPENVQFDLAEENDSPANRDSAAEAEGATVPSAPATAQASSRGKNMPAHLAEPTATTPPQLARTLSQTSSSVAMAEAMINVHGNAARRGSFDREGMVEDDAPPAIGDLVELRDSAAMAAGAIESIAETSEDELPTKDSGTLFAEQEVAPPVQPAVDAAFPSPPIETNGGLEGPSLPAQGSTPRKAMPPMLQSPQSRPRDPRRARYPSTELKVDEEPPPTTGTTRPYGSAALRPLREEGEQAQHRSGNAGSTTSGAAPAAPRGRSGSDHRPGVASFLPFPKTGGHLEKTNTRTGSATSSAVHKHDAAYIEEEDLRDINELLYQATKLREKYTPCGDHAQLWWDQQSSGLISSGNEGGPMNLGSKNQSSENLASRYTTENINGTPPATAGGVPGTAAHQRSGLSFVIGEPGVAQVFDESGRDLFPMPSLEEYYHDMEKLFKIRSAGPVISHCFYRLKMLHSRFELYHMTNYGTEQRQQRETKHRDFYNVRKVDNHIHHAAAMNSKHLTRFMKKKFKRYADDIVGKDEDGNPVTLAELAEESGYDWTQLTINSLGMWSDRSCMHRFDRFNNKYMPMGQAKLRALFLKTDNIMKGR